MVYFVSRGGGNVSTNISIGATTNFSSSATGGNNFAAGNLALRYNTTGAHNTAIGRYALRYNTTGFNNTAIGNYALNYNTTGN
jgi:trimeric autotransporter adhesin